MCYRGITVLSKSSRAGPVSEKKASFDVKVVLKVPPLIPIPDVFHLHNHAFQ